MVLRIDGLFALYYGGDIQRVGVFLTGVLYTDPEFLSIFFTHVCLVSQLSSGICITTLLFLLFLGPGFFPSLIYFLCYFGLGRHRLLLFGVWHGMPSDRIRFSRVGLLLNR